MLGEIPHLPAYRKKPSVCVSHEIYLTYQIIAILNNFLKKIGTKFVVFFVGTKYKTDDAKKTPTAIGKCLSEVFVHNPFLEYV